MVKTVLKTIVERYGSHVLTINYYEDYATVKVEDIACLRFPLIFSETMTKEQANSYLTLFKACGYVAIA